jgi:hypothetical protein
VTAVREIRAGPSGRAADIGRAEVDGRAARGEVAHGLQLLAGGETYFDGQILPALTPVGDIGEIGEADSILSEVATEDAAGASRVNPLGGRVTVSTA